MKIATAVLDASPAAWEAMLNFTKALRKVPPDLDGRTAAQKAAPGYRPFRSLWLPGSEPDPGYDEYDAARALNALGFEAGKATMALLERGAGILSLSKISCRTSVHCSRPAD